MLQRNNRQAVQCRVYSVDIRKLCDITKPRDITKKFWEKAIIQFHGTCHGLKITSWFVKTLVRVRESYASREALSIYFKNFSFMKKNMVHQKTKVVQKIAI